jgi:hypothetical protein
MRDYRLPKSHRRSSRVKPLGRKKPRTRVVSAASHSSFLGSIFKKIMLIIIGILALAGVGYGLFREILPSLLPLNDNKNIVIVSSNKDQLANEILVAHFRPNDSVITAVKIPAEQSVTVAGGFGEYPLRSVWQLLDMEKKDDAFIRSAFSFAVGEVIDGVVVTTEPVIPSSQPELQKVLRSALYHGSISGLSRRDQISLMFFAEQLPSEKVKLKTLESWEAWTHYRSELSLQFPEADCPVAVVNTTQKSGLAAAVSEVVEQTGYTVVQVTDNPELEPHSRVAFASDSEMCGPKAALLSHLFPQKVPVQADAALTQTYRAKIILELGEDIESVVPLGN